MTDERPTGLTIVLDPAGVCTALSADGRRLLGTPEPGFTGRELVEVCHRDDRAIVRASLDALCAGREQAVFEARLRCRGQRFRWFEAIASARRDEDTGELREVVVVARDTTDRRRYEQFLRLLREVTVATSEAETFEDALERTLAAVCRASGWPAGHAYRVSEDMTLVPTDIWYVSEPGMLVGFREVTAQTALRVGQDLPGRVLADGHPHWTRELPSDATSPRAHERPDLGVRGAFACPIQVGPYIGGVLEFVSDEPLAPDTALLDVMGAVGVQLGRTFECQLRLEELRRAEEHARVIVETALDAYVGMDEAGRISEWNVRAEEVFGWSQAEAIGRSVADTLVPAHLREDHRAGLERFLATGWSAVLNRRLELPALHRDGHTFAAELTIWATRLRDRWRFNAFVRDVSDQQRMRANVELIQQVTRACNEADDLEGPVRAVLAAVCQRTGWPVGHAYLVDDDDPDRLVSSGWWHVTDDAPPELGEFQRVSEAITFRRGEILPGEVLALGKARWMADRWQDPGLLRLPGRRDVALRANLAFPVLVGERVVAVLEFFASTPAEPDPDLLAVMENVGAQVGRAFERDRARRVEQARVESERRFLSMATHDLRSPLTAIAGYAGLLDDAWDDLDEERRRRFVGRIAGQAERMRRLVEDFLLTVRLQAGALPAALEEVDLPAAVRQCVADLGDIVGEVEVRVDGTVPPVRADPHFLSQILVNLLSNARKYGAPPVVVELRPDDGRVELRVRDRGPGVPDEFVPQLFDRFARAGHHDGTEGSGLGLSIVRELAVAQGGDVRYEPGGPGACFVVTLPAADPRGTSA